MANVVDHNKMRNDLLDGAIRTVACQGLEGTTTRQIASAAHLNEAYIYRYYLDRTDLLEKAFLRSDRNFFSVLKQEAPVFRDASLSYRERARRFFDAVWDYSFEDLNYCRFYTRYYHSSLFNSDTEVQHKEICNDFLASAQPRFRAGADVEFLMHHIFITFIGFVMSVAQGLYENTPEIRGKVFEALYQTVLPYMDAEAIEGFST